MRYSGKYEVISQLGRGSMGTVFKVRHVVLETVLALKVLPAHLTESEDLVKRFYREARVMARMNHPNIARVIDVQKDEELGLHYFVMEYIDGQTLRDFARQRGPLPAIDVLMIAKAVAAALDYAHKFSPPVIHRDIKPTNIMVEGASKRVVVMDFGIAKELDESEVTRAGTILGTLKYCPPEQMRHEPLDGGADVYALGMVMYELLAGNHLLSGLSENELVRRVLEPDEYQPLFPAATLPQLADLIRKAITKNRLLRHRRMEDLQRDLQACWVMLDEDQITVIGPTPSLRLDNMDAVADLESQIQKLSAEREQRILARLKAQVATAREAALSEGATQVSGELLQEAAAQEQATQALVQEKKFDAAQEALRQAEALYQEARDRAIVAKVVQSATRARDQSLAAREEADRYAADKRAATYYSQAMALQTQADELWSGQSYREAGALYGEACSLFEASQERAYKLLLEEDAKLVREQVLAKQKLALTQRADTVAEQRYDRAQEVQQRAELALGHEEFGQARDLFNDALRKYEQVLEELAEVRERQRFAADRARESAHAARLAAESAGATDLDEFQGGLSAQGVGETRYTGNDFEPAAAAFAQSTECFQRSQEQAERIQAEGRLAPLRQQGTESFAAVEAAQGAEVLPQLFAELKALRSEAEAQDANKQYSAAAAAYRHLQLASAELLPKIAEQKQRQAAASSRDRLHELQRSCQSMRGWAPGAWNNADELFAQVEGFWAGNDYARVVERAGSAEEALRLALTEAGAEQNLAAQTEAARGHASQAKSQAAALRAEELAAQEYHGAVEEWGSAEKLRNAREWLKAKQTYTRAAESFTRSVERAEQRQAELAMEQAQQRVSAARMEVDQWSAAEAAASLYEAAANLERKGKRAAEAAEYVQAREFFEQAEAGFREAGASAMRRSAEDSRNEAVRLRQKVRELGGKSRAERPAKKWFDGAEKSTRKGDYATASKHYQEAAAAYTAVLNELAAAAVPASAAPATAQRSPAPRVGMLAAGLAVAATAYWLGPQFLHSRRAEPVTAQTAPLPTTAPSASELKFLQWLPESAELLLPPDQGQDFSVRIAPAPGANLRYDWYLDEVRTASGAEWHYKPDAGQGPKRIRVVVSAADGRRIERTWRVSVPVPNRPPSFAELAPSQQELELSVGEEREFRARAADPDSGDELRYRWFEDDHRVGESNQWRYRPQQPGQHRLIVEATDRAGLAVRSSWDIRVKEAPKPTLSLELVAVDPAPTESVPLILKPGQSQRFKAQARSNATEPLQYAWYVDGKLKGQGPDWLYSAEKQQTDQETRAEIRLVVSVGNSSKLEKSWTVQSPALARPPQIVNATPRGSGPVTVEQGSRKRFTIEARDPAGKAVLNYRWLFDGKEVAGGPAWELVAAESAAGTHKLEVVVVAADGSKATKDWTVRIAEAQAPLEIAGASPAESEINAAGRDELDFAVEVKDAEPGATKFHWTLDGRSKGVSSTGQVSLNPATMSPGQHVVAVTAVSKNGTRSEPRQWTVIIAALPTVVPTAAAPPTALPTAPVLLTQTDVKRWLAEYVSAWNQKDIDTLIAINEVSRENSARLKTVLAGYQSFSVDLENVEIEIDGDKARISFRRIDTIEGKTLPQPDRKTIRLHRKSSGALERLP